MQPEAKASKRLVPPELAKRVEKVAREHPALVAEISECGNPALNQINWCMAFIAVRGELNKNVSSYGYKHEVESWRRKFFDDGYSGYISNESFIIAAILCGYNVFTPKDKPFINGWFSKCHRMRGAVCVMWGAGPND